MGIIGLSSLDEFLGERVVYRSLQPANPNLPAFAALAAKAGLPPDLIPRKIEPEYAHIIAVLLTEAQRQRGVTRPIARLLYLGDTRLLDGSAFGNICQAGGWPGLAFIGAEDSKPPSIEIVGGGATQGNLNMTAKIIFGSPLLYLSNRWAALNDFGDYAVRHGLPIDEATVVVVDIDKTALGARGRNGHVIDQARVQAVYDTVAILLGGAFDPDNFRAAYDLLNRPEFHPLTADNQDYLAYFCLILGSGLVRLEEVITGYRDGQLKSFEKFIYSIQARRNQLPPALAAIHREIFTNVQNGDPTPFKAFRRNEYLRTIACFGCLGETELLEAYLNREILVTEEVRQAALAWQRQGALLFGLSDKPDEAATPTPELAAQGFQPIHRARTHALVG
jgi:hypothetical protein